MAKQPHRTKGIFALIILSFIFAFYGVMGRYLNGGFHIFQQIYIRMALAFIWSLLLFRIRPTIKRLKQIPTKDWMIIIFRAATYYLFGTVLYLLAVTNTKLGNVAVIGSIPMTAVFGFMLGEKFTWKKFGLVLTAFLGAAVIGIVNFSDIFVWGKGEIFTLLSVVVFSLSYVSRKWQSNILSNKEITSLIFFFAAGMLFVTSLIYHDPAPVNVLHINYLIVLILGALLNVVGLFLTNYGFEHVDNVLAGNILTLEAVFGILLGLLIYKEVPNAKEIVGSVVIVASVIALNNLESKNNS